jgi:hypothetical protein
MIITPLRMAEKNSVMPFADGIKLIIYINQPKYTDLLYLPASGHGILCFWARWKYTAAISTAQIFL